MNVIGIDPGVLGAIAALDDKGELLIWDCPTFEPKDGKRTIDAVRLADILDEQTNEPFSIWLEEVHAIPQKPGEQPGHGIGSSQTFAFGRGYGIYLGIFAALRVPYSTVRAAHWKKAMKISSDKEEARRRATSLMPQHAHNWSRKKDHGRAEAALIAWYGAEKVGLMRFAA